MSKLNWNICQKETQGGGLAIKCNDAHLNKRDILWYTSLSALILFHQCTHMWVAAYLFLLFGSTCAVVVGHFSVSSIGAVQLFGSNYSTCRNISSVGGEENAGLSSRSRRFISPVCVQTIWPICLNLFWFYNWLRLMKRCRNRICRPSHTSIGFVLNFCKLLWFHLGLAPATEMGRLFQHNPTNTGLEKRDDWNGSIGLISSSQRSTKLSDGWWGTVSSFSAASAINSPTFSRVGR
jgi:hypothetical protein